MSDAYHSAIKCASYHMDMNAVTKPDTTKKSKEDVYDNISYNKVVCIKNPMRGYKITKMPVSNTLIFTTLLLEPGTRVVCSRLYDLVLYRCESAVVTDMRYINPDKTISKLVCHISQSCFHPYGAKPIFYVLDGVVSVDNFNSVQCCDNNPGIYFMRDKKRVLETYCH